MTTWVNIGMFVVVAYAIYHAINIYGDRPVVGRNGGRHEVRRGTHCQQQRRSVCRQRQNH